MAANKAAARHACRTTITSQPLYSNRATGGANQDMFFFAKGGGHDQILDFDTATDLLDLSKWHGVETLARVRSHAHEEHGGLMIEAGHGSLFLRGIDRDDLTTLNFADMQARGNSGILKHLKQPRNLQHSCDLPEAAALQAP